MVVTTYPATNTTHRSLNHSAILSSVVIIYWTFFCTLKQTNKVMMHQAGHIIWNRTSVNTKAPNSRNFNISSCVAWTVSISTRPPTVTIFWFCSMLNVFECNLFRFAGSFVFINSVKAEKITSEHRKAIKQYLKTLFSASIGCVAFDTWQQANWPWFWLRILTWLNITFIGIYVIVIITAAVAGSAEQLPGWLLRIIEDLRAARTGRPEHLWWRYCAPAPRSPAASHSYRYR